VVLLKDIWRWLQAEQQSNQWDMRQ